MKAKAVSALRSKRGLRPVVQVAEPQVVGLTPQPTNQLSDALSKRKSIHDRSAQPNALRRGCCRDLGGTVKLISGFSGSTQQWRSQVLIMPACPALELVMPEKIGWKQRP